MIADYEISRVPYFASWTKVIRVQCLWCDHYVAMDKGFTEDQAIKSFLQHFQAKHQK